MPDKDNIKIEFEGLEEEFESRTIIVSASKDLWESVDAYLEISLKTMGVQSNMVYGLLLSEGMDLIRERFKLRDKARGAAGMAKDQQDMIIKLAEGAVRAIREKM